VWRSAYVLVGGHLDLVEYAVREHQPTALAVQSVLHLSEDLPVMSMVLSACQPLGRGIRDGDY